MGLARTGLIGRQPSQLSHTALRQDSLEDFSDPENENARQDTNSANESLAGEPGSPEPVAPTQPSTKAGPPRQTTKDYLKRLGSINAISSDKKAQYDPLERVPSQQPAAERITAPPGVTCCGCVGPKIPKAETATPSKEVQ